MPAGTRAVHYQLLLSPEGRNTGRCSPPRIPPLGAAYTKPTRRKRTARRRSHERQHRREERHQIRRDKERTLNRGIKPKESKRARGGGDGVGVGAVGWGRRPGGLEVTGRVRAVNGPCSDFRLRQVIYI